MLVTLLGTAGVDEVGVLQQSVELDRLHVEALRLLLGEERVIRHDLHLEALGPPGELGAYAAEADYALVCDLCETDGTRGPECVEVCPNYALEYMPPQFPQHLERIHPDQKAEYLSQRLYPLPKDQIQVPPEELFKEER